MSEYCPPAVKRLQETRPTLMEWVGSRKLFFPVGTGEQEQEQVLNCGKRVRNMSSPGSEGGRKPSSHEEAGPRESFTLLERV